MSDFNELRYPFDSLLDFIRGGYFAERAGLHLTIALVLFGILTMQVLLARGPFVQRLITLFFAGAVYNNAVFTVPGGLHFNEIAGVLAALWIILLMIGGLRMDVRRVGIPILVAGLVLLAHAALVSVFDGDLIPDNGTAVMRAVLVGRIFVLGIIAVGMESLYRTREDFETLIEAIVRFGVAAIIVYFIQTAVFLSGTRPYGTYWDAGFTGIPSFGAVSIERGHFGKFLILLFPFFAWVAAKRRRWLPMLLFLLVTLVNFSASSMSFLAAYIAITVLLLFRDVVRPSTVKWLIPAGAILVVLVSRFGEQYSGLVQKIMNVGVRGEEGGGRSFSVLEAYLTAHPLGLGYSGSTLRNVGTLPQINMGAYALVSQLSLLVIPVLVAFLWLNYRVIRESGWIGDRVVAGVLVGAMLTAILIDLVDILWFVPTIWAPMIICSGLAHARRGVAVSPRDDRSSHLAFAVGDRLT
jgi:hypothetical protein